MKNFFIYALLAVIGIVLALGSSLNEGGSAIGAWVGMVYAIVVAAFVAIVDNQAFDLGWNPIWKHMLAVVAGAVLGALYVTIF